MIMKDFKNRSALASRHDSKTSILDWESFAIGFAAGICLVAIVGAAFALAAS